MHLFLVHNSVVEHAKEWCGCGGATWVVGVVKVQSGSWPPGNFWILEALRSYLTVLLLQKEINYDCSIRVS